MKKASIFMLVLVCATLVVAATPCSASGGQEKAKPQRWHGLVVRTSEDGMVLTVRRGTIEKAIHVNEDTRWSEQKGSETVDIEKSEVKDGDDVICLGTLDDKGEFVATRVDKRLPQ
jgi:hypothetical protein